MDNLDTSLSYDLSQPLNVSGVEVGTITLAREPNADDFLRHGFPLYFSLTGTIHTDYNIWAKILEGLTGIRMDSLLAMRTKDFQKLLAVFKSSVGMGKIEVPGDVTLATTTIHIKRYPTIQDTIVCGDVILPTDSKVLVNIPALLSLLTKISDKFYEDLKKLTISDILTIYSFLV